MKHNPRFLQLVDTVRAGIREVSVADVKAMLDRGEGFHLLDVREAEEWRLGHLPTAVHLCKGILERDIESAFPDPTARLVLYCGGGYRSALAAEALQRMGYREVASMDGGWRAWTEAGLPVVTDGAP